ncbi:unnamed protein product [Knipowitschia caucasica]
MAKTRCMSHSDAFTFHLTALEVKSFIGTFMCYHSVYSGNTYGKDIGTILINVTSYGQLIFHCLTCVERYVAAVHPITYMRLKKGGGVTIRNISIVLTRLCVVGQALIRAEVQSMLYYAIMANIFSFSGLVVVVFCSVSVLRVLIGPKPGKNSKDKWKVDQSKRLAFITMLVIMGALLMRFVVFTIQYLLTISRSAQVDRCVLRATAPWFSLPSGMVLPLLFLYREGKPWIKNVNQ